MTSDPGGSIRKVGASTKSRIGPTKKKAIAMPAAMAMHDRMIRFRSSSRCSMKPIVPLPSGSLGFSGTRARERLAMVDGFYGEPGALLIAKSLARDAEPSLECPMKRCGFREPDEIPTSPIDRFDSVRYRDEASFLARRLRHEARLLGGLSAAGMAALAPQLGLLTFFLTVLAAVFAPWSAFGDYTGAGGMRAFLGVGHLTPPGAGVILLTFSCAPSRFAPRASLESYR
jgi:hypothetical protein